MLRVLYDDEQGLFYLQAPSNAIDVENTLGALTRTQSPDTLEDLNALRVLNKAQPFRTLTSLKVRHFQDHYTIVSSDIITFYKSTTYKATLTEISPNDPFQLQQQIQPQIQLLQQPQNTIVLYSEQDYLNNSCYEYYMMMSRAFSIYKHHLTQ